MLESKQPMQKPQREKQVYNPPVKRSVNKQKLREAKRIY